MTREETISQHKRGIQKNDKKTLSQFRILAPYLRTTITELIKHEERQLSVYKKRTDNWKRSLKGKDYHFKICKYHGIMERVQDVLMEIKIILDGET